MENDTLTAGELRVELKRTRALATLAENAGEADATDLFRSTERALLFGLQQLGERE